MTLRWLATNAAKAVGIIIVLALMAAGVMLTFLRGYTESIIDIPDWVYSIIDFF